MPQTLEELDIALGISSDELSPTLNKAGAKVESFAHKTNTNLHQVQGSFGKLDQAMHHFHGSAATIFTAAFGFRSAHAILHQVGHAIHDLGEKMLEASEKGESVGNAIARWGAETFKITNAVVELDKAMKEQKEITDLIWKVEEARLEAQGVKPADKVETEIAGLQKKLSLQRELEAGLQEKADSRGSKMLFFGVPSATDVKEKLEKVRNEIALLESNIDLENKRHQDQITEDNVKAEIEAGDKLAAAFADAAEKQAKAQEDKNKEFEKIEDKLREDEKKAWDDHQKDLADAQQKIADAGKKVFESVQTPLEKYKAEIADLGSLLKNGAIDQATFARAGLKAADELASASDLGPVQLASADQFGSANAASAIQRNNAGNNNPLATLARNSSKQLDEQIETNAILSKITSSGLLEFAL